MTGPLVASAEAVASPARRRMISAMAALACLGWMPGCVAREPLRISSHVWPGYEFMFLARSMGWLRPTDVQLVEVPAASDSMHAINARLVDGAALTLDEVLRVRAGGVPLTVVAVFDVSAGADVLLARPGIADLAGLAGKSIAVERSALGALMLSSVLKSAGVEPGSIKVVHATIDQHEQVWQRGEVDAVISYPPVSERLEKLGAVRLFDSRSMPDRILDVLAVRSEVLQEKSEQLRHLVDRHFHALEHFRTNPRDAVYRLSPRLGIPAGEVMMAYQGLSLPDARENRRLLAGRSPVIRQTAGALAEMMFEERLLPARDSLSQLIAPDFVMEMS